MYGQYYSAIGCVSILHTALVQYRWPYHTSCTCMYVCGLSFYLYNYCVRIYCTASCVLHVCYVVVYVYMFVRVPW